MEAQVRPSSGGSWDDGVWMPAARWGDDNPGSELCWPIAASGWLCLQDWAKASLGGLFAPSNMDGLRLSLSRGECGALESDPGVGSPSC